MDEFDNYKKRLDENREKTRIILIEMMGENCLSIFDIAKGVGVSWATMKRFLVEKRWIDVNTLGKVHKYIQRKKK